jgi:hypothetical protein
VVKSLTHDPKVKGLSPASATGMVGWGWEAGGGGMKIAKSCYINMASGSGIVVKCSTFNSKVEGSSPETETPAGTRRKKKGKRVDLKFRMPMP